MTIVIILFGFLILLSGVLLVLNPEIVFGFLGNNIDNPLIHVIAVLVRLIIGTLLVTHCSVSRLPVVIEVLGWVFIFAAVILALMGRSNFRKLLSWVLTYLKPYGRLAGVASIVLGGFFVYAYL